MFQVVRKLPCVIVLATAALLGAAPLAGAETDAPAPTFVGKEACTTCHADAAKAWTGSHHDWALKPPTSEFVFGDFSDARFEHDGTVAVFSKDGDDYIVTLTEPGEPDRRAKILYAVGVTPLQQYLVETEPGRLQVLDIAWDTKAKRWFNLYPSQHLPPTDGLHWTGPYKTWNARCADCHHTDFDKGYDPAAKQYHSKWAEIGVTCESCHGPGSVHTAWAEAREAAPGSEADILRAHRGLGPTGLTIDYTQSAPNAEIDRCFQCHARREPLTGHSPIAGTPFADAYRLSRLTPELYFPDGQDKEEVYNAGAFLQSRMHAVGVRCSDCHDPHSATLKAEGNAVCTQCHSEAAKPKYPTLRAANWDDPSHTHHEPGSTGAQCVSCHMPVRTYMQVDPRRDHGFRVPRPDISGPAGAPDVCTSCHAGKDWQWAAATIKEWFPDGRSTTPHFGALFAEADAEGPDSADLVERLLAYANDLSNPPIVRASAIDRVDVPSLPTLDRIRPLLEDPDANVRSAAVELHRGTPPEIRAERLAPRLDDQVKAVRIDAARVLADVPPAAFPEAARANLDRAMGEYQAYLKANSDTPETQMALGGVALTMRSYPAAASAFLTAAEFDSGLVEAWRMAARIDWALGDTTKARETLDKGLAANPKSARLLQVKAGLQAATGDTAGAVSTYEDAVTAEPDDLGLRMEYADFLANGGANPRALDILQPMLASHPSDPELLFLIARSAVAAKRIPVARAAIAAFRRTNANHQLTPEIDRLEAAIK